MTMPTDYQPFARLRRCMHVFICFCACVGMGATSAADDRFTGSGALQAANQISGDGRFEIKADLQRADSTQSNTRFDLKAKLAPSDSAKGSVTSCGPLADPLFKNGFET
jgi:hypothetical protein